jgi:CheY-like chemotaxis protein
MKILLIDDNDDTRRRINRYLGLRFTAQVTDEPTGPTGKQAGDNDLIPPWDAVVIDRQLLYDQGMGVASGDGLTLAAIFRRDPNYAQAAIIVYSVAWVSENDPETNSRRYLTSGIFPCPSADATQIANLISAHVGNGPWTWQPRSLDD